MSIEKTNKKDPCVELLRIIAATMVIGVHVNQGFYYFDKLRPTGVYISCLVGDGVAVFWMIMGFFLFNSEYDKLVKKTIKRVLIPMFLYMALMFYFGQFLSGSTNDILAGFRRPLSDYKMLFTEGLLKWQTVVPYTGQFWYLFCYTVVVLAFPALNGIVSYNKEKKSFKTLFIVLFLLLFINDITLNGLIGFSHAPFQGAMGASFIVLFGYMIYSKKDLFENKTIIGLCGLVCFLLLNAFRAIVQYHIATKSDNKSPIYWFTTFAVLNVYFLTAFAFGFKDILNNRVVSGIIRHLGGLSMGIYFVHMIVIERLKNAGVMDYISSHMQDSSISIVKAQILKMGIVIIISLIVVEIYMICKCFLCRFISKRVHCFRKGESE